MYDYLGDSEIISLETRLEMLTALKKIKTIFGEITPCQLEYWEDINSINDFNSMTQISQYYIFDKLSQNDITLNIFAGDTSLVQNEIANIYICNTSKIIVEAIILEFTYADKEKYEKKFNNIVKELHSADPLSNEDTSFITFKNTVYKNGKYITSIYFPCIIRINQNIVDAILNVFKK